MRRPRPGPATLGNDPSVQPKLARRHVQALVALVIGTAIAAIATTAWLLIDGRRTTIDIAAREVENLAIAISHDLERVIATQHLSLLAVQRGLTIPGILEMPPEIRDAILFDGATQAPHLGRIAVLDTEGRVVVGLGRYGSVTTRADDRDYFTVHRDRPDVGLFVGRPVIGRASGQLSMSLSLRRETPDGAFDGILVGAIRLSVLDASSRKIDLGENGAVTLARADGAVLYRTSFKPDRLDALAAIQLNLTRVIALGSGTDMRISPVDGNQRMISFRKVGQFPLYLVVSRTADTILEDWRAKAVVTSVLMTCLVGLALGLMLLQHREIDRSTQAEAEARLAGAQMRAWFDNAPDTLFKIEVNPGRPTRVRALNPAAKAALGIAGNADPRTLDTAMPADLRAFIEAKGIEAVETRLPVEFEHDVILDGERRTWHTLLAPVSAGEATPTLVIGAARDVTDQRRHEEADHQAQKLAAIGQLTAGVSHDFNNLLQVMTASLELIDVASRDTPELHDLVGLALNAAQRGADLTHHLLSFSRRQMLRPTSIDLVPFLSDVGNSLQRTLGSRIRVVVEADGDAVVHVDPTELELALLNLGINARDAMPDGGQLRIAASLDDGMTADGRHSDAARRQAVISVSDTGSGICATTLRHVFEPFFTTKEVGQGSGLGLSMVQGFARQSGGEVTIDSVTGKGTTVRLWLPLAEHAPSPPVAAQDVVTSHTALVGARILLVDDEESLAETLGALLAGAGFTVTHASSATEALDALDRIGGFDVVVSDQNMPDMTGIELLERVRRRDRSCGALIITGANDAIIQRRDKASFAVLRKPFRRAEFVAAVTREAMRVVDAKIAG